MIEAAFWLLLLTMGWLLLQGLLWSAALYAMFDFAALRPAAWLQLYRGFMAGGTVRFDFAATLSAAAAVTALGQILLMLHLPSLLAWMPPFPEFRLRFPTLPQSRRTPSPKREPDPPRPPPPPSPQPQPPATSAPAAAAGDSACIARMLALFEVWNDPPAGWMKEAMHDEAAQVSEPGWTLLRDLGAAGLRLAVLLEAQGLIPERPQVRAFFDEFLAPRQNIAAEPATAAEAAPALTVGAAWLCEILDNLVPHGGETVDDMLGRAIRGMTAADWASLDRFPEKAGRVRVVTDRLAEDLRQAGRPVAGSPADMAASLLRQFGFSLADRPMKAALLAEREDLTLLLRLVDLRQRSWRLPDGPLGTWLDGDGNADRNPGRALWQELSMLGLRRPPESRLRGVLVAHGGSFADETELARRNADRIDLVWLHDAKGALPDLQRHLAALADGRIRVRPPAAASRRAVAPS
jgi:hypothetical protein